MSCWQRFLARGGQPERLAHRCDCRAEPFGAVILGQEVFLGGIEQFHPLVGGHREERPIVEAVEHVTDDLDLLDEQRNGLALVDANLVLAAVGVDGQRLAQVLGQPEIVDDEPTFLASEDTIDPGDGLHQPVPAHRLVNIHGVHRGDVEASQPHVPDDDQPQRIVRVLVPPGDRIAALLAPEVRLHHLEIGR